MIGVIRIIGILVVVSILAPAAGAEDQTKPLVDKSRFHLFNPTPKEYLRELSVDGPGTTESPYTVDAGHFQIEMSLASYSTYHETFDGVTYRLEWWAIAPMTLKLGVLNRLDLQVLLEPYNVVYEREGDYYKARHRGFGDTTLRVKYNIWGNDSGRTAFAATPWVKFPTSQHGLVANELANKSIEGGIVFPLAVQLPHEFYLGLTTKVAIMRDFEESGYHGEFGNSIALEHPLFFKDFAGYVEFYSLHSTERDAEWIGTFDTGFIYYLSDHLQLNAGVNIGLTRAADEYNPFVGLAWRF
jgi:hypothetical protein